MNERIRELYEQAAKTTQGDSWEEQTEFMEKFAELLIRKCYQVTEDNDCNYSGNAYKILEHFGVEE